VVDDGDLAGLDPYDIWARETDRLDRHFAGLDDDAWQQPSRCEGWSVRDVLAHMRATENYIGACLNGTVQAFLASYGEKGATDLATANDLGIREYDQLSNAELLRQWRADSAAHRREWKARDGGDVDTSVGAYPARWQAFHLAFEVATHAGDVHTPAGPDEAQRVDWQARFGRFALKEMKPETTTEAHDDRTHVVLGEVDVDLPNAEFVDAVAARLPVDSKLDEKTASALSVTP
jgi:uncharacterized protein (TIGR03083 family)